MTIKIIIIYFEPAPSANPHVPGDVSKLELKCQANMNL